MRQKRHKRPKPLSPAGKARKVARLFKQSENLTMVLFEQSPPNIEPESSDYRGQWDTALNKVAGLLIESKPSAHPRRDEIRLAWRQAMGLSHMLTCAVKALATALADKAGIRRPVLRTERPR
jgi:hypothetical protein